MALTPEQLKAREGKLTASEVGILMKGDQVKIMNLWRAKVGDPDYVPDDLSGIWAVNLGSATEELNLDWYQRKYGPVTRRGEVVVHPTVQWAAATLDGFDGAIPACIECKHVGGREPRETVIARYMPQFHWQMMVTGTVECRASIIEAANEPVVERIRYDSGYAATLWDTAHEFMRSVESLTPPVAIGPIAPPVRPTVTYDKTGSNEWASAAADWLETIDASKKATAADKTIKAMIPSDAERCFGHGIEVIRDRAGRLSIKKSKK